MNTQGYKMPNGNAKISDTNRERKIGEEKGREQMGHYVSESLGKTEHSHMH